MLTEVEARSASMMQMVVDMDGPVDAAPTSPTQGRLSVGDVLPGADIATLESGGPCTDSPYFTATKALKTAAANTTHLAQREARQEIPSPHYKACTSGAKCTDEKARADLGQQPTGRHILPAIHRYILFHPHYLTL